MLVLFALACRPPVTAPDPVSGDPPSLVSLGYAVDAQEDGQDEPALEGLTVAMAGQDGAPSVLVHLDAAGSYQGQVEVSDGCSPSWIDRAADGAGWVIVDGYARLARVDQDGACAPLADLPGGLGAWGVAATPEGYYVSTLDGLSRVVQDGQVETLATWSADYDAPETFQAAVSSVAVSGSGTVGLFDLFGGFATWSEAEGLDQLRTADVEQDGITVIAGAALGEDWIALAWSANDVLGLYAWDGSAFVLVQPWTDDQRLPGFVAGAGADLLLTSAAGQRGRVWRWSGDEPVTIYESDADPGLIMVGVTTF